MSRDQICDRGRTRRVFWLTISESTRVGWGGQGEKSPEDHPWQRGSRSVHAAGRDGAAPRAHQSQAG